MITLHDLDTAIAKCQGETKPNADTCIKLAAFYTIKEAMFGKTAEEPQAPPSYSYAAPPVHQSETTINYNSGTEFAQAIDGVEAFPVWEIMDELMSVLQATNPRLFAGVMRKIDQI